MNVLDKRTKNKKCNGQNVQHEIVSVRNGIYLGFEILKMQLMSLPPLTNNQLSPTTP